MYFQVKEVILWPHNTNFEPRRVEFELGKVNVITGSSRSGKSALIPIIDYCLGSSTCAIPVREIRDSCSWFGVLIALENSQLLLARRNPGPQKQTGDMYVLEGPDLDIPSTIEGRNDDYLGVKRNLDELAGLPMLDYGEEDKGYASRPSFRDTVSFLFQSQNIIANQDILFYKANEFKYQERLRNIFPYVLNAVNAEWFYKKALLNDLKNKLRIKEKEYSRNKGLFKSWQSDIRAKVLRAKDLGLISRDINIDANPEYLLGILRELAKRTEIEPTIDSDTVEAVNTELKKLRREDDIISLELSKYRRRIKDMDTLKSNSSTYFETLKIMRDRLDISEWVKQKLHKANGCPFCENNDDDCETEVESLVAALKRTEEELETFSQVPSSFDREYKYVKSQFDRTANKLGALRHQIKSVSEKSSHSKKLVNTITEANRFVGRLEEAMSTFDKIKDDSAMVTDINNLKKAVADLKKAVSGMQVNKRIEYALNKISQRAGKYIDRLDSGSPDDAIVLDIKSLTVVIKEEFRDCYLWEIGSGSNWLAYHISSLLALHTYFTSLQSSPVPSFLIFDQPSQVHFPQKVYVQKDDGEYWEDIEDDDAQSVTKIFSLLNDVASETEGKLQLIVFDHAPKEIWEGSKNVNLVETWRNGQKLIPLNWLDKNLA